MSASSLGAALTESSDERVLVVRERNALRVLGSARPGSARVQGPAGDALVQRQSEDLAELSADGGVGDPGGRLDPAVKVAVHHVGAADPYVVIAPVAEAQDA